MFLKASCYVASRVGAGSIPCMLALTEGLVCSRYVFLPVSHHHVLDGCTINRKVAGESCALVVVDEELKGYAASLPVMGAVRLDS